MNLKEIRKKILSGDFGSLLKLKEDNKNIHPTEVAAMLSSLPDDTTVKAFQSLPNYNQVKVFPYLDILQQRKIIKTATKPQAGYILNELISDDRMTFFTSLRGLELSACLEVLTEKNRNAVHKLLGYPANSIARLINTDFATIQTELTIREANEHLRKNHKDSEAANVIYVVDDEGKLIDDIPVRRFVLNDPEKKIKDILDGYCTSLKMTDTKEDAVA
jgi:magnesium transporter